MLDVDAILGENGLADFGLEFGPGAITVNVEMAQSCSNQSDLFIVSKTGAASSGIIFLLCGTRTISCFFALDAFLATFTNRRLFFKIDDVGGRGIVCHGCRLGSDG